MEELQQAQTELKARVRDVEHYRTEVHALHATSSDATKLLSEKLSLSRELAVLKPELGTSQVACSDSAEPPWRKACAPARTQLRPSRARDRKAGGAANQVSRESLEPR